MRLTPRDSASPRAVLRRSTGRSLSLGTLGTYAGWLEALRAGPGPAVIARIRRRLAAGESVEFAESFGHRSGLLAGGVLAIALGLAAAIAIVVQGVGGKFHSRGIWLVLALVGAGAASITRGRAAGTGLVVSRDGMTFGTGGLLAWDEGLELDVGEHGLQVRSARGQIGRIGLEAEDYYLLAALLRDLISSRGPK